MRRSERKKSTEVVSSQHDVRHTRRSRRSSSQVETPNKTHKPNDLAQQNENAILECKKELAASESCNSELKKRNSPLPSSKEESIKEPQKVQELETIAEVQLENNEEIANEKNIPTDDLQDQDRPNDFDQNVNNSEKNNTEAEVRENSKKLEQQKETKYNSPKKSDNSISFSKTKKNRSKERRANISLRKKDQENNENDEFHNTKSFEKTTNTRKRKWTSKRISDSSPKILAISTDSLKNLISDVHPVPLSDVKLESSPDVVEVESEREEGEASPTPVKSRSDKKRNFPILEEHLPPIPTKYETSPILYITNLVRPFTILQLKSLLARTGKIVDKGFWIDKIKSKCFVQYVTEDEAIETRHALHGVRWPSSNPKCLNVDFGTAADMDKAMKSQNTETQLSQDIGRIVGTGWDRGRCDFEEKRIQVGRPVREWDVGKKDEVTIETERARKRDNYRGNERGEHDILRDRTDNESVRKEERNERDRERDRKRRRDSSVSPPARKIKHKSNDPPIRLLDDLFRKTKVTPCIYWLPLTPEQIAEKEAFRLRRVAEHQERIRQRELAREKGRERERENGKERRRERNRSVSIRRTNSRDRRRY